MVKQKNIIIGSATGYNADLISSFVYSLGKTDFDGILTLIIYKEQMTEFVNAFSDVKILKLNLKFQLLVNLNQSQSIQVFININL